MSESENSLRKWYAVYTRARMEHKVFKTLEKRKIIYFYPYYNASVPWWSSGRNEQEPLFPSRIFIYINENEYSTVNQSHGLLHFVYWRCKPAVIPEAEIEGIKKFLNDYSVTRLEKTMVDTTAYPADGEWIAHRDALPGSKQGIFKLALPFIGYSLEGVPKNDGQININNTSIRIKNLQKDQWRPAFIYT